MQVADHFFHDFDSIDMRGKSLFIFYTRYNHSIDMRGRKYSLIWIYSVDDSQKILLAQECVCVHQSVILFAEKFCSRLRRHVYVTPKSYLDLIALFGILLVEKKEEKTLGGEKGSDWRVA